MKPEEVIRRAFSSMPSSGDELGRLLAFGVRLDDVAGFPRSSTCLNDLVFGNPRDTVYTLTPRVTGGTTYDLAPPPSLGVFKVELVLAGGTLQDNVFLQEDGSIESVTVPAFARVKSFARTSAFVRLCAQPCAEAFHAIVTAADAAVQSAAAEWSGGAAYDAFSAILNVLRDPGQLCVDARRLRDRLCVAHTGSKVTTNFMQDAVLRVARQPLACGTCLSAAAAIEAEREKLHALLRPVFGHVKATLSAFFTDFVIGSGFARRYPLLAFSPAGCEERTQHAYDRCVKTGLRKQDAQLHGGGKSKAFEVADVDTEAGMLRACGRSSRAVRLRDVSGPDFTSTVAGHWNDACVTAHVCESTHESVLARLVVVTPETDIEAVLNVARGLQGLAKHADGLEAEFGASLRSCCTRAAVDARELDVATFERLEQAVQRLASQFKHLTQVVLVLVKTIQAASCCFDSSLGRLLQAEHTARVRAEADAASAPRCAKVPRARTLCPLGRHEYLTYRNDGTTKLVRSENQHACFGSTKNGRIVCIDPTCVKLRGGDDAVEDLLAYVSEAVAAGVLQDPVHDFLQNEGRCRVCLGSAHFAVTDSGRSIACTRCRTTVHTSVTLVERHDAASGCLNPAAGVSVATECGTLTCLGCGLVLSDYMCIDSEADERVFLDDDMADPTHHAAAASVFLTNGSNVTYLSKPRDATPAQARCYAKYAYTHQKLNTYVFTDNAMRLTTWVKRDAQIKALQQMMQDLALTGLLRLAKTSQDVVVSRFHAIRWSSEKMCGTRLLVFALVVCEVVEARERFAAFRHVAQSTCCACGETLACVDVRPHLLRCGMDTRRKKKQVTPGMRHRQRQRCMELLSFA